MKTRIDLYNTTFVAFVESEEGELRQDFKTREEAEAWVATFVKVEPVVKPKVRSKKPNGQVEAVV